MVSGADLPEGQFTVVGGSGVLDVLQFSVPAFLAIHDPLGITSIQLHQSGGPFRTFDNVTVAIVPEPQAIALLAGVIAIGMLVRRQPLVRTKADVT